MTTPSIDDLRQGVFDAQAKLAEVERRFELAALELQNNESAETFNAMDDIRLEQLGALYELERATAMFDDMTYQLKGGMVFTSEESEEALRNYRQAAKELVVARDNFISAFESFKKSVYGWDASTGEPAPLSDTYKSEMMKFGAAINNYDAAELCWVEMRDSRKSPLNVRNLATELN